MVMCVNGFAVWCDRQWLLFLRILYSTCSLGRTDRPSDVEEQAKKARFADLPSRRGGPRYFADDISNQAKGATRKSRENGFKGRLSWPGQAELVVGACHAMIPTVAAIFNIQSWISSPVHRLFHVASLLFGFRVPDWMI